MADRSDLDRWRRRVHWCRGGMTVSLLPIIAFVMLAGGKVEGAQHWWLAPMGISVIVGIYCAYRFRKAFIAYQTANGASKEDAKTNWKTFYGWKPD